MKPVLKKVTKEPII